MDNERKRQELEKRIDHNLQLLNRVVPHSLLLQQCETLEHNLLIATVSNKTLCEEALVHGKNKAVVRYRNAFYNKVTYF